MRSTFPPTLTAAILLLVVVAALYLPTVRFAFLCHDDGLHLYRNPILAEPGPDAVARFWEKPYESLYIPVAYTLWTAQAALTHAPGQPLGSRTAFDPALFHGSNVVLHAICALLVLALLVRLTGSGWPALLGTLLFAAHPLQVESVAWISEFRGLLSGLFCLLATWCHLEAFPGREDAGGAVRITPRHWPWHAAELALFALALLSKPSAVPLPAMLYILDAWRERSLLRPAPRFLAHAVLLLPVVWMTTSEQSGDVIDFVPSLAGRIVVAADTLSFYFCKIFQPLPLLMDYGRKPALALRDWGRYLPWALAGAAALAAAAYRLGRGEGLRDLGVGAAICVAGLLPVSGIIPFLYQNISTVADRYMYLPLFGVSLAAALFARHVQRVWKAHPGRLRAALALSLAACAALAAVSAVQVRVWNNDRTVYPHTLAVNPASTVATQNLAESYVRTGDYAKALQLYTDCLALTPDNAELYANRGSALRYLGRDADALPEFRKALELDPAQTPASIELADALLHADAAGEAVAVAQDGLEHAPDNLRLLLLVGLGWERIGDTAKAYTTFLRMHALAPEDAGALDGMGRAAMGQERYSLAVEHFAAAVRQAPLNAGMHANLALALAAAGRFNEARAAARTALGMAPDMATPRELLRRLDQIGSNTAAP